MPPQSPGQPQQGDTSLGPFWIVIGLFTLLFAVWYFAHEQITAVLLRFRLWEAEFIQLFDSDAGGLISTIQQTSPAAANFTDIANISTEVGGYFRFPVAVILVILAGIIYFGNAIIRFKRTYSMKALAEEEKVNWPQITPVTNLDLVDADIDKGPWAMAMTPMQFAKKEGLLRLEKVINTDPNVFQRARLVASINREDAYRVFSLQLGPYWTSPDDLNIQTKALFAIFAARIARDREAATNLLLRIAASTSGGKLDFSGVEALLAKHRENKTVAKIIKKHAFVSSVLASMLVAAREDGVLAAADFLWLKPIDRRLWFMLNSVGRQTPFTEVGGSFAHWLAEKRFGQRLSVPMVEEAVNALDAAIKDVVYVPEEGEMPEEEAI